VAATAASSTAFHRLQQGKARDHHQTECRNSFHVQILRLMIASSKYECGPSAEKYQACFSGVHFASVAV
jgi:hypothetical protein